MSLSSAKPKTSTLRGPDTITLRSLNSVVGQSVGADNNVLSAAELAIANVGVVGVVKDSSMSVFTNMSVRESVK